MGIVWRRVCLCLIFLLLDIILSQGYVNPDRRRRDDAVPKKVTTIAEPPYLTVKDAEGVGNARYEGYIVDLMKKIADKAKLSYQLQIVGDNKYGAQTNGGWNGMIGEVISGAADMAAAPITVSEKREEVVDFTEPYMTLGNVILIKKPVEGEPPINSAKELAEQTDIKYGVVKDGLTQQFFQESKTNPTYKAMWDYMDKNPDTSVATNEEGVEKVRTSDGKYAFIMENTTAEYWIKQEPCDLETVGPLINEHTYAFIAKKGSGLVDTLNEAIQALKASGDLEKIKKKWWKNDGGCGVSGSTAITGHVITILMATVLGSVMWW